MKDIVIRTSYLFILSCRNETVAFDSYEYSFEVSDVKLNYSSLYHGMIYPFTRMVIYGVIWYQGESNSGRNNDQYPCTFSRLIHYWRQTWNERTNNITDIQFPFGFVQVMKLCLGNS